jgi:protein SCO1/2
VKNFDPRIVGLTGSPYAVASAANAYRVYYRQAPGGSDGYTVDHSAFVYLMDRNGNYLTHFLFNTSPDAVAEEIKKHINEGNGA